MMGKLNVRSRASSTRAPSPVSLSGLGGGGGYHRPGMIDERAKLMHMRQMSQPSMMQGAPQHRARSSTSGSLRSFKLSQRIGQGGQAEVKIAPTF